MNRSLHAFALSALSAFLSAAVAAPLRAEAPNLLTNGSFDSSIAGWEESFPAAAEFAWVSIDAGADPRSGAIRLSSDGTTGWETVWADSSCVQLVPGQTYAVGARAWVDPSVPRPHYTSVVLNVFSGPSCSGSSGVYTFGTQVLEVGEWQHIGAQFRAEIGQSARLRAITAHQPGDTAPLLAYFDDLYFRAGGCAADPYTLCLGGGRFRVFLTWGTATDFAHGRAVPFSDEAGSFWFFSRRNLELSVKVIDGCSLNRRFWVFASGLTDVEVTLQVQDTQTGEYRSYTNVRGGVFETIADTNAFASCP